MKLIKTPSFADDICEIRKRKVKSTFFKQINLLIDWRPITNIINKHYTKGESITGKPAYSGLLLFKMSLLQTWYGLSDYEVEDRINDSISFSSFCDLSIEETAPDHSTLSRFRKELTQKGVYEKVFREMNKQLEKHSIIVKTGAIVDASVIDSPFKPKGRATFEVETDRMEDPRSTVELEKEQEEKQLQKMTHGSVDTDAAWLKKAGKLRYGYKKHIVTESEGLVIGVTTTAANVNEIANLEDVLEDIELPAGCYFYGDKGYKSAKNDELLKTKQLKNRILKKAKKGNPLKESEKRFNKLCGRIRFKVERTFGSTRIWFNSNKARYFGIAKMHTQNLMEAMAYNLYRSPGIIARNAQKIAK
ncbi:IS5 family transposase [Pedobacter changchengzhani]|uniref:IS5 family transposase n=1 Tax=Pedobacter changchengzhani TaxID=2529274 RepID=A0A4R5MHJ3_9SPHI|nr:IS5 family transposase [Pedobacter changchengzhani]TDG34766.1 IS5 family transposase [Pedobacter changchengzhani]